MYLLKVITSPPLHFGSCRPMAYYVGKNFMDAYDAEELKGYEFKSPYQAYMMRTYIMQSLHKYARKTATGLHRVDMVKVG